ncbi:ABC transporter permease, partial [Streptomyces pseudovenezuelae]
MTAPIETTGAQAEAQPEAVLVGVDKGQIEGRSLGQIAWSRFKKDKVAVAGGVIVILLILLAVLSRPIQAMFGLDPNALHQDLIDPNTSLPKGDFGGMSWSHPLGVEPKFGRDIATRILEGSWVSLVVAFGATILSNTIGAVLGVVAGYYGGRVDTIISRLMDTFLAFPLL